MAKKSAKKDTADALPEEPKEEMPKSEPKEEKPKEKPKAASKPKEKPAAKKEDPGWYDAMLKEGEKKAEDLPPQLKGHAKVALNYLKDHKEDLFDLGKAGLDEFLNLLSSGAKGKARDHFIRTKLGPDGLIAAMKENNEALKEATIKRATFEAQATEFLKTLGNLAVNVLRSLVVGELAKA